MQSRPEPGVPDTTMAHKARVVFPAERRVELIGAPFCEGQNLEGADLAPCAMREAGLPAAVKMLGWEWHDAGDIQFEKEFNEAGLRTKEEGEEGHHDSVLLYREWLSSGMRENFSTWVVKHPSAGKMRRNSSNLSFGSSTSLDRKGEKLAEVVNAELIGYGVKLVHDAVANALLKDAFVLTVGGDHSIATGSICAATEKYPQLGVIWVDAHADANTPRTSPSMHYHGMPAAHLLGWFEDQVSGFEWFPPQGCLSEGSLAYVGLRDVDVEEGQRLRASNVHVFTMRDVDKYGVAQVIEMAIKAIDPNARRPLFLSLDIDSVDPHFAPGTGTAARGGLTYREIHYICEELALTDRLVGMDLVEVNPGLDPPPASESMHGDHPALHPASPTVQLAVELSLSALGKQIM